jgi:hypothetical protein
MTPLWLCALHADLQSFQLLLQHNDNNRVLKQINEKSFAAGVCVSALSSLSSLFSLFSFTFSDLLSSLLWSGVVCCLLLSLILSCFFFFTSSFCSLLLSYFLSLSPQGGVFLSPLSVCIDQFAKNGLAKTTEMCAALIDKGADMNDTCVCISLSLCCLLAVCVVC